MATSGPGATNLVTSIADAKLDSVPIIAITGQVPQMVIGSDAFQETPIVSVCQQITKHQYLITADDPHNADSLERTLRSIPRIVKEAFFIAQTGRPGPVLIDFPKNIQLATLEGEIDFDPPMSLPGYRPEKRGGGARTDQAGRRRDSPIKAADPVCGRRLWSTRAPRKH